MSVATDSVSVFCDTLDEICFHLSLPQAHPSPTELNYDPYSRAPTLIETRKGKSLLHPSEDVSMQILFINSSGGGFADHIDVAEGTTVTALFAEKMPGKKAVDYLIRVNRQPVSSDQVLQPNDRISFTPVKIEGARAV